MSYHSRMVLNHPLDELCYNMTYRGIPMSAQRSDTSTISTWSNTSATSYQTQASSQHQGTMQHSSFNSSYGPNAGSQRRGASTSPSDKSDGDSKEKQYCTHPDCTDEHGRYLSSFSRKADVARHVKSTHEKEKHYMDCPMRNCSRTGTNGFTRKEHLQEHLRGYHGADVPKRQNSNDDGSRPPRY